MSTQQDEPLPTAVENLRRRVEQQSKLIEALSDEVADEREARQEAEAEMQEMKGQQKALKKMVEDLKSRTNMLRMIQESGNAPPEQRRAAMLQHLEKKAKAKEDRPDEAVANKAKAELDHERAEEILHYPDIDRTTLYNDMSKAAEMVDNEHVCYYENGKLVVNLERGEIPDHITALAVEDINTR